MPLLDDLSGYEFEDLMEDVFRNLGYQNVRQSKRTGDEGRDVLMEEVVDGQRRAVVVECKHRDTVSRPTVQKLHSAVTTYDYDGPTRGMVVTTGRFTEPAQEYAETVNGRERGPSIELLDGQDLREIGERIGMNLYNGRIEIICEATLRPFDPTEGIDAPVKAAFDDVRNIDGDDVPPPTTHVQFRPLLRIVTDVDATFETSVGVIHRIDTTDRVIVLADRDPPRSLPPAWDQLVQANWRQRIALDEDDLDARVDGYTIARFGQTETDYKEWVVDELREHHTTTVHYTGDNNVDYEKTCEPRQSDISVQAIEPIYLPRVEQTVQLHDQRYTLQYVRAGPSRETETDEIHACRVCETTATDGPYTYCDNCGRIACADHIATERLEGTPVCTACTVTERFCFATKHFYDETNLETFRAEYESMPVHAKAQENPRLLGGLGAVVLTVLALVALGVI